MAAGTSSPSGKWNSLSLGQSPGYLAMGGSLLRSEREREREREREKGTRLVEFEVTRVHIHRYTYWDCEDVTSPAHGIQLPTVLLHYHITHALYDMPSLAFSFCKQQTLHTQKVMNGQE